MVEGGGRDSPRRATSFLVRDKKGGKETRPTACDPCGATCVGAFAGCAVELTARYAPRTRGRAQRWPERAVFSPALVDAPAAGCLRGGMRAPARMLRELTRRVCPNGAPQARSELCGEPRKLPAPGLPRSEAQGSQTEGRLSFAYFSLAKQRKVSRPPGRDPAPALRKSTE